jgi:hypothetical protein
MMLSQRDPLCRYQLGCLDQATDGRASQRASVIQNYFDDAVYEEEKEEKKKMKRRRDEGHQI